MVLAALTRDRLVSICLAAVLHGAAFCLGGAILIHPPAYGIDTGGGGIEVNLVAAPPRAAGAVAASGPAAAKLSQSESVAGPAAPKPSRSDGVGGSAVVAAPGAAAVGDGSSPVPGMDPTTLHTLGGGWTAARPGPFTNLAPRYPESARKQGQEGLVVLRVVVDRTGRPMSVDIKRGSGFSLLDEAAVQAVRRWRFAPARAGSLAIDSTVEIPIRFRLEENTAH